MLVKLYKTIDGTVHYFEAWNNRNKVVLHWGILGRIGDKKIINVKKGETVEGIIREALEIPRKNGYQEMDSKDHKLLVIQYRLTSWGSARDLKKRHEVEDVVNECLGWTGNGICDRGDIGSGSINIYSYVVDPVIACKNIVVDLRGQGLLEEAVIAYRVEDDYVVLWPEDFAGTFSVL